MKNKPGNILAKNFLDAAESNADNTALEIGQQKYSYHQLLDQSLRVAACIGKQQSGDLHAVLAYRSFQAYTGVLGSLLASGGYVPLNPKFPVNRSLEMIRISGAKSLVVGRECYAYLREMLPGMEPPVDIILEDDSELKEFEQAGPGHDFRVISKQSPEAPHISVDEEDIAYLLFTSGSTGKPKAVPVSNLNVTSYLHRIRSDFDFTPEDRFSQTFDLTFDLSVHDMFVCWLSGACLVVPESDTPFVLAKYIREKKISVWFSVPSVAIMLDRIRKLKENAFPALRLSFFCGEALYYETALKWQMAAPDSLLINLYGPAEATIAISRYVFSETKNDQELNGILSIGEIFKEQHWLIKKDDNYSAGEDEEGELCLGGSQVISSYFNDQENTESRFFEKDKRRWYKTGDLVRAKAGKLFFLGRTDSEVKVSGYRVNLHEIEYVISGYPGLERAVSLYYREEQKASGELVAFVSSPEENKIREKELFEHCRKNLPWYMVPQRFIFVKDFPYNENGKIDRKQLKEKYV